LVVLSFLDMAAPVKPPHLQPGHAYVHISSSASPDAISNALGSSDQCRLQYLGPVGELKGEHIFEIRHPDGQNGPMGGAEKPVLEAIKEVQGIREVNMMDVKQRAKRQEF